MGSFFSEPCKKQVEDYQEFKSGFKYMLNSKEFDALCASEKKRLVPVILTQTYQTREGNFFDVDEKNYVLKSEYSRFEKSGFPSNFVRALKK
jgi:hypothetical protein